MTMHLRSRRGGGIAAPRHLPSLAFALAPITALALMAGCGEDPQSGNLEIHYEFAPGTSCDMHAENVISVRAVLGEEVVDEAVPCDNAGGDITLSGAPAGNYDLFVYGMDDEDDDVLDNLGGTDEDDRVEIIGGNSATIDVTLGLVPATLEINLTVLNNGVFAQCTSEAITVKGLRAEAWDFGSSDQLKSREFDLCDFDDFLPVPDEERDINGRRFDAVVLQPLDATGGSVGPALEVEFGGAIGAGKTARIQVQCENEDCTTTVLEGDPGNPDPTGGDPTAGDPTGGGTTGGDSTGGDPTAGDTTGGGTTGA